MEKTRVYRSRLILEQEEISVEAPNITNSQAVIEFAQKTLKISSYPEEVIFVVCLSSNKRIIDFFEVSRGTLTMSPVGLKELFKRILICNSHSFVLIHNHPNAEAIPSPDDDLLTEEIKSAAKILALEFVDHVIIGTTTYFSYREMASREEKTW